MTQPSIQQTRKPYDEALEAFEEADENYKMLEKGLLEGEFIPNVPVDGVLLKGVFHHLIEDLKEALEERNARLKNVQDLLRQQVTLETTKQRGPDGKPTALDAGPFTVSSVTSRWFDPKSLFDGVARHGLLERLHELKTLDKEGKERKLVQQVWEIDYANILTWLKANKLEDVIDSAYDETEKTPMVKKGPKPLSFLGDEK